MQDNLAVDVPHLAKRYGRTVALADLTLRVERGSIFGFLGPNGAGKTTAVKILLGLARPSEGKGKVLSRPLGDVVARQRIGYLPEQFRYPDWLTAREVLGFQARLAGIPRTACAREISRVLDLTGLRERGDDRVSTYSKGMQQRLGLAVALLGPPDLIFLDEPTSALDPVGRHDVRELLRVLRAQGKTVFLNSHLLTEVEQVCDHVAIIQAGRIVANGTLEDVVAGGELGVRVRAHVNGVLLRDVLKPFGDVGEEDDGTFVRGVPRSRVPEVVTALVDAGAQIYSIEPVVQSLEQRFLDIIGNI